MLVGNRDLDKEILLNLDDKSLFQYCQTGKYAYSICNDESFWANKVLRRFGSLLGDVEKIKNFKEEKGIESWRDYYVSLINTIQIKYDDTENPNPPYEDDLIIVAAINKNTNDLISLYENQYVLDTINGVFSEDEGFNYGNQEEEVKEVKEGNELDEVEEWKRDLLDVNLAFFRVAEIYDDHEDDKERYLIPILDILLGDDRFKPQTLIVALDFDNVFQKVLDNDKHNNEIVRKMMFSYILAHSYYKRKLRIRQLSYLLEKEEKEGNKGDKELFTLMLNYMADHNCVIDKVFRNMIIEKMKEIGITRTDFASFYKKITAISPDPNYNFPVPIKNLYIEAIKCLIKYF